jgi:hypothetical protein
VPALVVLEQAAPGNQGPVAAAAAAAVVVEVLVVLRPDNLTVTKVTRDKGEVNYLQQLLWFRTTDL